MLLGVGSDGPVPGRRVVITGMGIVSCCGIGLEAFWEGLHRPAHDGERRVEDFDPAAWFGPEEVRARRPLRPVLGGRRRHGAARRG